MKDVYVIMYTNINSNTNIISKEAYNTLEDAQKFIESRSSKYQKLTEYIYADSDSTMQIYVVTVK